MYKQTIELPDEIGDYLQQHLNGHPERLNDYLIELIEEARRKEKAVLALKSVLSDPKANTPSQMTVAQIKQKAMNRLQN
ncbi:MAG: hypothetical protein RI556_09315 [Hydrogenovibrio sp.]|uniref:hypothetical protein n=1 Tax=Hydrogenovibrio TaxID=28884 RepID=UPI0003647A97|nr:MULTISPECIES: hypothetical protein [Hydrogenovibrio]MDR9499361.1 hypothetical protein [Hydrogenovibrio sp.]